MFHCKHDAGSNVFARLYSVRLYAGCGVVWQIYCTQQYCSIQVTELQSQLESAHEQLSTLQAELSAAADRSGDREQQLLSEISTLNQAKETLSVEIEAARETLELQVQELDDKVRSCLQLCLSVCFLSSALFQSSDLGVIWSIWWQDGRISALQRGRPDLAAAFAINGGKGHSFRP